MADQQEVAPPSAEEENSNLLTLADIAEASGVGSLFESQPESTESEVEETTEEEVAEEEELTEVEEEPAQIEEESEEPQGDSEGVKKRIGKLIEARNQAEEETAELRKRIEQLESASERPARQEHKQGEDRFSNVSTLKELQKLEDDAEHLREWLLENPDGGDYTDLSGDEHEVEYDQARKLMVQTDRDLRKNIGNAREKIHQRQNNIEVAKKTFEWMADESSPEMTEARKVLDMNKDLKAYYEKDPFAPLTLAYAMEGIKAVNARNAKKPVAKTAPVVPSAPSRAKPQVVKGKQVSNRSELLKKARSGELDDASTYIESIL